MGGEVRAYDEGLVKDLQGAVESVKLTKEQPSAQLTLTIDPTEYLVEYVGSRGCCCCFLSLVPLPKFSGRGFLYMRISCAVTRRTP